MRSVAHFGKALATAAVNDTFFSSAERGSAKKRKKGCRNELKTTWNRTTSFAKPHVVRSAHGPAFNVNKMEMNKWTNRRAHCAKLLWLQSRTIKPRLIYIRYKSLRDRNECVALQSNCISSYFAHLHTMPFSEMPLWIRQRIHDACSLLLLLCWRCRFRLHVVRFSSLLRCDSRDTKPTIIWGRAAAIYSPEDISGQLINGFWHVHYSTQSSVSALRASATQISGWRLSYVVIFMHDLKISRHHR